MNTKKSTIFWGVIGLLCGLILSSLLTSGSLDDSPLYYPFLFLFYLNPFNFLLGSDAFGLIPLVALSNIVVFTAYGFLIGFLVNRNRAENQYQEATPGSKLRGFISTLLFLVISIYARSIFIPWCYRSYRKFCRSNWELWTILFGLVLFLTLTLLGRKYAKGSETKIGIMLGLKTLVIITVISTILFFAYIIITG